MSGRFVITCDICGKEIEGTGYYQFRERFEFVLHHHKTFFNPLNHEPTDMDMCESCLSKFKDFVNQEKTGAN